MNYYNPYFYTVPYPQPSLFNRLFGGISFNKILNGTERALNFANQAIPLVKQVKPMIGNAKTIFKIMNEFKRTENKKTNNIEKSNTFSNNGPKFFA